MSGEWGRTLEGGGGTGWMDGPHAGGKTPMLPGRWIGDAYEGLRIAFCCESRAGWLRLGLKLVLRGRHCRSHHARTHARTRHAMHVRIARAITTATATTTTTVAGPEL